MTLRLGGLILAFCAVASAATPTIQTNFNLFRDDSNIINWNCWWYQNQVREYPLNYPQIEKVTFELRTQCSHTVIPANEITRLRNSDMFDANKKTVVFISGWSSNSTDTFTRDLHKAYLCRGGHNFIVVNTADFLTIDYLNAAYNTEKLGEFVALGLKNLNIPSTNIHLIGHSLGAHIAGSAARKYAADTGNKIARITGLDPARPCFIGAPVFKRLTATDANFVDIIHSNVLETGTDEAIGTSDFYPTGWKATQPGCLTTDKSCSHTRSVDYYVETVYSGNENNFMATPCPSYWQLWYKTCTGSQVPMGFAANESNKGIYILDVNEQAPLGKNSKGGDYLKLNCGVCIQ